MSLFTQTTSPELLEDEVVSYQQTVSIFLFVSLLAHGLDIFFTSAGVLEWLIPAMEMIAAVTAIVFFIAECLLLPVVGILIMTAVSALLYWVIPYFVAFMVQSFIESIIFIAIGGVIMALSVGAVIVIVDGIIIGAVVMPLMVTPLLAGFGAMGVTVLAVGGAAAGVNAGLQQIRPSNLMRPRRVIVNLLLMIVVVWPALTWAGVLQGVFALKPVKRAEQQYRSFAEKNISFTYENFFNPQWEYSYTLNGIKDWTFDEGFYDSYIYPGRNTFAQGAVPASSKRYMYSLFPEWDGVSDGYGSQRGLSYDCVYSGQ